VADRGAQVRGREQPQRAEAARGRDGTRQLGAGKATAHPGLCDRNIKAKSIQQVH
jgi:hypothetical protein